MTTHLPHAEEFPCRICGSDFSEHEYDPTTNVLVCPKTHVKIAREVRGVIDEQGPLVRQPSGAARLARILHHAANELWDLSTYMDVGEMSKEARAIARRILAASLVK